MVFSIRYKGGNGNGETPTFRTEYGIRNTEYIPRELRSRGMTMIETVVWIAVLSMALLALTISLLNFYRVNKYAIEQASAVASAQHGIDAMIRTIREAAYSSEGAFPIVSIGAHDLVFYADVDADPLIEKVHYYVSGTSLIEGVTNATGDPPAYSGAETLSTLSDHVQNLTQGVTTFRYYGANGAEITDYSNWAGVRFVSANISVNVDPNKLPSQLILGSSAALRNLK